MPKKLSSKYSKDKGEIKESRQDYKSWRKSPETVRSRDKSITISPKEDRRYRMSKTSHDRKVGNERKEQRSGEYAIKSNRRAGEKKTLLEQKTPRQGSGLARSGILRKNPSGIKRTGIFNRAINRKKEKGVTRKEYDTNFYEPSDDIAGVNVSKHRTHSSKEYMSIPRDQRKYVSQGVDSEGNPIKEKGKRKRVLGKKLDERGLKTDEKWKRKRVRTIPKEGDQYYEQKYVDWEDGKRVKKRGSGERDARRYVRKGVRRQYIDPDKEGKYQYVGTGEEVGKKPKREKRRKNTRDPKAKELKAPKPTREEKKATRQQKRKERERKRRDSERRLAESSGGGGGYNRHEY
tara:strand:- start:992 stop:2032 length:1041 start_codon:yes stop_codon:yes gene_type:complete